MLFSFLRLKLSQKAVGEAVIRIWLIRSFLGTRNIVAFCLLILILVLGVGSCFGIFCFSLSTNPAKRSSGEKITIAKNIEVVSQLEEEKWSTLLTTQKLNVR